MDIAISVDRLETSTTLQVRRLAAKWAGLRSFVADRTVVCGFDPAAPGFFWLAGQGGYGIQTSPAMARVAGALAMGRGLPQAVARSEEHTSELQSLMRISYAVFCLTKKNPHTYY